MFQEFEQYRKSIPVTEADNGLPDSKGKPWCRNDEKAAWLMVNGYYEQTLVKFHLQRRGIRVQDEGLRIRDTWESPTESSGKRDLLLFEHNLEMKARDVAFVSPGDWPYDTVIVDTKSDWDQKAVKPLAYIFFSQRTRRMIWTPGGDSSRWIVDTHHDRVRGYDEAFYEVGKHETYPMHVLVEILRLISDVGAYGGQLREGDGRVWYEGPVLTDDLRNRIIYGKPGLVRVLAKRVRV